jgi:aryl-alcohol dehydrogenase-like predicted oxidoreductase
MARELGMGVTPWSPLKSGILSGKYSRQNATPSRGWAVGELTESTFALLDELARIARSLDTTVARVALAWVQGRPGVTSTILGARTLAQLEDNLAALEVRLPAEAVARLDALTTPKLNFPGNWDGLYPAIHNGGTTVNGVHAEASPFGVTKKGDHY